MVSWAKAYYKAIWVIIYSVIWWIIGGFILSIGLSSIMWDRSLLNFALILTGICIAALGSTAAIIKVSAEIEK